MALQNCPLCHNHCPVEKLSCGKGKKYFASESDHDKEKHEKKHGHKEDRKEEQKDDREDEHSHGHKKHHGKGKDDLLGALDEQQKAELKEILKILVKSWKDE